MKPNSLSDMQYRHVHAELPPIYAITPFTLQDFPGLSACIIWLPGCNMSCGYCHNPDIVRGKSKLSPSVLQDFLVKRQGKLDGIVVSGGEASLHSGILPLAQYCRSLGYKVKLDTNGTRPDRLSTLLQNNCLDYVALDYKAPQYKYTQVTNLNGYQSFSQSLDLLIAQTLVKFEVRTTVHSSVLNECDINCILEDLSIRGFSGNFYLQNFRLSDDRETLGQIARQCKPVDLTKLKTPTGFSVHLRNF